MIHQALKEAIDSEDTSTKPDQPWWKAIRIHTVGLIMETDRGERLQIPCRRCYNLRLACHVLRHRKDMPCAACILQNERGCTVKAPTSRESDPGSSKAKGKMRQMPPPKERPTLPAKVQEDIKKLQEKVQMQENDIRKMRITFATEMSSFRNAVRNDVQRLEEAVRILAANRPAD